MNLEQQMISVLKKLSSETVKHNEQVDKLNEQYLESLKRIQRKA